MIPETCQGNYLFGLHNTCSIKSIPTESHATYVSWWFDECVKWMPLLAPLKQWSINTWHFVNTKWLLHISLYLFSVNTFYASAFRRRRHYVFGLSVRPSVRSLKYPLLTCTWVRWSTRPTVTVLRHVRPSVRPSVCPSVRLSVRPSVRRGFRAFAWERMEGMAWNFTCWCILTIFRTD